MFQGLMVSVSRRTLWAVFVVSLFFALLPTAAGAKIIMKKQYGPAVFPKSYTDTPWAYSAAEACDIGFLRRQQDWPGEAFKDNPYVDVSNSGEPNGCRISRYVGGVYYVKSSYISDDQRKQAKKLLHSLNG